MITKSEGGGFFSKIGNGSNPRCGIISIDMHKFNLLILNSIKIILLYVKSTWSGELLSG
jgi:hypothetical protein